MKRWVRPIGTGKSTYQAELGNMRVLLITASAKMQKHSPSCITGSQLPPANSMCLIQAMVGPVSGRLGEGLQCSAACV